MFFKSAVAFVGLVGLAQAKGLVERGYPQDYPQGYQPGPPPSYPPGPPPSYPPGPPPSYPPGPPPSYPTGPAPSYLPAPPPSYPSGPPPSYPTGPPPSYPPGPPPSYPPGPPPSYPPGPPPSYPPGPPQVCPANSGYTSVVLQTNVVAYPVVINQYFEQNTNIVINGGVTININNAPTTLSTTVTATTTATVTVTVAPPVETPFLIQISGVLAKRAGGITFLGEGGSIVNGCPEAAEFTIDASGQLSSDGEQVSTSDGATEQLMAVSPDNGDITTIFSASGGFSWAYPSFSGGAATFCSRGNLLYAEFTDNIPEGCYPVELSSISAAACPGLSATTTLSTVSIPFSNSTSSTMT